MNIFYLLFFFNCALFVGVLSNLHFITSSTAASLKQHFSNFCSSQVFNHDVMTNDNQLKPIKNSWNKANVNESATLNKMCLYENGLPVTRKCIFDSKQGAVWEPMDNGTRIQCIADAQQRIITPELYALQKRFLLQRSEMMPFQKQEILQETLTILQKPKFSFLPADVYLTTQILHDIVKNSNDPEISKDIVKICNTLMSIEENVLCLAAKLNSTNIILKDFENYMNSLPKKFVPSSQCNLLKNSSTLSKYNAEEMVETVDLSNVGVYAHLTDILSIFFINPNCANITGIAIYDNSQSKNLYKSRENFYYRFVYSNENIKDLMKESNIQVATFIPERLWQYIKGKLPKDDQSIIVKVYANDSLFVQPDEMRTCRPSSKIISISIPGFSERFPESLPFLVRSNYKNLTPDKRNATGTGCGYWNYETWLKDDIETKFVEGNGEVVLCGTKHLTQFSFLVGGQYRRNDMDNDILISPIHIKALDIISVVGCSLSLLGLFGIWITAAIFKFWRSLSSTKVLLNMCLVLTIQMILFVFVHMDHVSSTLISEKSYKQCIALGAFLQYILLVLFTWMLLIAILQFQRYVTIIGIQRPRHFILKSAIIAWGLPLLPTLIVILVDHEGYISEENQACYPSGYGFAFGVIFPISIICIANLTIFIFVFHSISHTLNQSTQRQEKLMVVHQIRLSILLFFLLGLCWIFGILAYMRAGLIFSYLFSLTASLQGFVLFLYFVIFNDTVRKAWCQLICSRDQEPQKKVREMQSITASSDIGSDRR